MTSPRLCTATCVMLVLGSSPARARAADGEPPEAASEADAAASEADAAATAATAPATFDTTAEDSVPVPVTAPRPSLPPPTSAVAAGPRPAHPLEVRWGVTAPVIASTGVGFRLMDRLGESRAPPAVCSPPQDGTCPELGILEPIDRLALGHYNGTAALLSDVTMVLALAGPVVGSLVESILWARQERDRGVARHHRRGAARFGINTAIWAESVGVAMFTTSILKDAVARPRPLSHLPPDQLMAEGVEPDGDFGRSFPSGHATITFSSAVAGAMLLTLEQCEPQPHRRRCAPRTRRQKVGLGLAWGLGLAAASATATLRVVAGKHYPTDVLMGAVLGASSGIAVPLLHDRRWRK